MANFNAVTIDGVVIVNTTPHPINFLADNGDVVEVPTAGVLINATPSEETVRAEGVDFVRTVFKGNEEGLNLIAEIEATVPGAVIVGSIIAAKAFPGKVFAMTPAPGFERVPPQEKRMNPHKFTTFE